VSQVVALEDDGTASDASALRQKPEDGEGGLRLPRPGFTHQAVDFAAADGQAYMVHYMRGGAVGLLIAHAEASYLQQDLAGCSAVCSSGIVGMDDGGGCTALLGGTLGFHSCGCRGLAALPHRPAAAFQLIAHGVRQQSQGDADESDDQGRPQDERG